MKFVCGHLLFLFLFSRIKIIQWSDNRMFISPHCVIFTFVFVNMWSIRMDMLGLTLVGEFINSLRPKDLQNSRYFFCFKWYFICTFYYVHVFFSCYWNILISLYSDPLVYVILRASLNCLTVFLETLFWSGGL